MPINVKVDHDRVIFLGAKGYCIKLNQILEWISMSWPVIPKWNVKLGQNRPGSLAPKYESTVSAILPLVR
jgi:hypothetical protein